MDAKAAKGIYLKIGSVICPALGNVRVLCTNVGFNHLVRRGRSVRSVEEQGRRFMLIPYITRIVSSPLVVCECEVRENASLGPIHFWGLSLEISGRMMKVVIRQVGDKGSKHFFSIMDSKIKKTPGRESL